MIPERFNIASAICRRHSDAPSRIALQEVKEAGINTYTFGALDFLSDKFAVALSHAGVNQGDSVAVMLPQSAALAVAHLGILKCGAVLVPLATAADAAFIRQAMADSGTTTLVVDESLSDRVGDFRSLPYLGPRFVVRDLRPDARISVDKDFWTEVDRASSDFEAVQTDPSSKAFIFYDAVEGKPAGVVHSHRSLIGQLGAFEMFMEPQANSVFWTANGWSAATTLLGLMYPGWWYGCAIVACTPEKPEGELGLLKRAAVTHALISSSSLNLVAEFDSRSEEEVKLRKVVCEDLPWPEHRLNDDVGFTLNCVYGRPETGWIVGRSERWFKTKPGFTGRSAPGSSLEVIDETGHIMPPGQEGTVAIHKSDPALFSEFHNSPPRTAGCFIGDWFLTGDVGKKNEDGDLFIHHPRL